MSASNLRLVQELYDAFARREVSAVFARFDPEVEIHQTELLPWGGHYRGQDGAPGRSSGDCSGRSTLL